MRKTLSLAVVALTLLGTVSAPPAVAAPTQTVTLAVENMTCGACPITVRKALEKVPGVSAVKVDLDSKTATVTFDPAKAKVDDLTWATTEAGYPSSPKGAKP